MAARKGVARNATPTFKVEIKRGSHGFGVYAVEDIPWGTPIVEYVGERISKQESDRRHEFYDRIGYTCIFELDNDFDLDGLIGGNEARFINHSKTPNCVPIRFSGRIYICSIDKIRSGTELLFDYGFKP